MNRKKILDKIEQTPDFLKGDVHQAILNVGYEEWEKNQNWNYKDMLEWVEKEYGKFTKFAILVGKYNQQVENGGHHQYISNSYSGRELQGIPDASIPLHKEMISLMRSYELHETEIGAKIYKIMVEFNPDVETDEFIDREYWDSENGENYWVEEYNEDLGSIEPNMGKLDKEYYKYNSEWIKFLNELFLTHLHKTTDNFYDNDPKIIVGKANKPKVKLIGENGNVFNIIGIVKKALIRAGLQKEAEEFVKEATSDDYNYLIVTALKFVDIY